MEVFVFQHLYNTHFKHLSDYNFDHFLRVKESVTAVPTNDKLMLRKSKIILKFYIDAFLEANYDLLDWFLMVLTLGVFVGMVAYLKDS